VSRAPYREGVCDECGGSLDTEAEQCGIRSCRWMLCGVCKGPEHDHNRHGERQLEEIRRQMKKHAFRSLKEGSVGRDEKEER
jgi:hypothetical protein